MILWYNKRQRNIHTTDLNEENLILLFLFTKIIKRQFTMVLCVHCQFSLILALYIFSKFLSILTFQRRARTGKAPPAPWNRLIRNQEVNCAQIFNFWSSLQSISKQCLQAASASRIRRDLVHGPHLESSVLDPSAIDRLRFGLVVARWSRSTKLLYAGPGYY